MGLVGVRVGLRAQHLKCGPGKALTHLYLGVWSTNTKNGIVLRNSLSQFEQAKHSPGCSRSSLWVLFILGAPKYHTRYVLGQSQASLRSGSFLVRKPMASTKPRKLSIDKCGPALLYLLSDGVSIILKWAPLDQTRPHLVTWVAHQA